jgi:hypothetical protein
MNAPIEPVRLDILETAYPGHGVKFDVWGLYPDGDRDLCRQCDTRPQAERYVAARYQPARLEITRHRFSTTQGEATLTYAGQHLDRYGDKIELQADGQYRGLSDDQWHDVARRVLAGQQEREPFTMLHDGLHACALTAEMHARTCGYWYTVESRATAHTAFATRAGLLQWAGERGLRIIGDIPEPGAHAVLQIEGAYRTAKHMSAARFYGLDGDTSRAMSNGEYTLAIITTDADGLRTVHTLNPNVKGRPVYDYAESRALLS